jgi:PhzF family phenazine biosynthesis protein
MNRFKIYIANAFSDKQFGGNPAAIVPLEEWFAEALMQQIAAQNNLSETAFIVPEQEGYAIRWFTPTTEVDLCGHATLASAHVLFEHLGYQQKEITFHSKSGELRVNRLADNMITLDFPAKLPTLAINDGTIGIALGIEPVSVYKSQFDYMAILANQAEIEALDPDFTIMKKLPARGLIVTAAGNKVDFVSRCFYPQSGINEDPATGSAHVVMVPYWAKELGKNKLSAIQLSARKGYLDCELLGDRVLMKGHARTYLEGQFYI